MGCGIVIAALLTLAIEIFVSHLQIGPDAGMVGRPK